MWVTAVLYGGPFAASLRLLLQNDSVMDIGSKGRIYGELLRLLNVLGNFRCCFSLFIYLFCLNFEALTRKATFQDMFPMWCSSWFRAF